ncbi:DUF3027 domain-containing protein [Mycetocola zhadangensis]|uniref:DUF3027 domain-containing protein n=1 Tax=Mycetocola zhadangensis TaxID=1164595 RepID=UPI003A4E4099
MNTAENSTTDPSALEVSEPDAVEPVAEPETANAAEDASVTDAPEAPVIENSPVTDVVTAADGDAPGESEPTTATETESDESDEEPVAKPAPVADDVLFAAADIAREALLKVTPASTIGEPTGHIVEDDHVLSLLFATTLPGYPGWNWTVTLARVEDGDPMVLETELMPGENALLAPEWIPWSERLADYRATQEAAEAESRALAEAAAELDDDEDDDDEGFSILHAGDVDGVDVDEIDDSGDNDESDEDDDESEEDDDDESDEDDESDDDESDDDESDDDDEAERTY